MVTKKTNQPFSQTQLDSTLPLSDVAVSSTLDGHPTAVLQNDLTRPQMVGSHCDPTPAQSGLDFADERFVAVHLHATGGIGRVWLAHDAKLDRNVALKELRCEFADDPVAAARFDREAKITGQLEHPGIIPIYELGQRPDTGRPFYTMRFVNGRTLSEASRAYHQKRKAGEAEPIELLQLLNAFASVCKTVAFAHSRGVVHQDLKGANVLLGDFGEVIVLDWGLARLSDRTQSQVEPIVSTEPVTAGCSDDINEGIAIGTPSYMSPEQAAGRVEMIDHRTDVYGLGTLLYEILTGRPPFQGASLPDVVQKVKNDPPISPRQVCPGIPQELENICLRSLEKNPDDRYQSAAELSETIQNWLAELAEEPLKKMTTSERQAQKALRKSRDQQRALIELIRSQAFQSLDLKKTFRRLTEVAARTLKVARVSIWRYNADRSAIQCADLYERKTDSHSSGMRIFAKTCPEYFDALASIEVIAAHDARKDPRTSELTKDYLDPLHISSLLDASTHRFGEIDGVLCHEHIGRAREWSEEEQLFGIVLANLVSLAMEQWERRCKESSC